MITKKKPFIDGPEVCFPIPGLMTQICLTIPGIGKHTPGPSVRGFLIESPICIGKKSTLWYRQRKISIYRPNDYFHASRELNQCRASTLQGLVHISEQVKISSEEKSLYVFGIYVL